VTHINCRLVNDHGDVMTGAARYDAESYLNITVNGQTLYADTWELRGWAITYGDEE